ncbi:MAG: type II secretion system protein GspG [Deltaproteobacteria bacterium]|nr:MAG: type II secretion system protein GspG [Deltaproteobacteria bacterium]
MLKKIGTDNRGFSLIELMVVIVILGILAGMIMPKLMGRTDDAKLVKAAVDIATLDTALKLYKLDNGEYPTTEQGLKALIEPPDKEGSIGSWKKGGYLEKKRIPKDPWQREFIYLSPGIHGEYDIISYGADGMPGGEGKNKDVKSWEID